MKDNEHDFESLPTIVESQIGLVLSAGLNFFLSSLIELVRTTIKWRHRLQPSSQDPNLETPEGLTNLIRCMVPRSLREHLVKFFKSTCFGLGHEKQD